MRVTANTFPQELVDQLAQLSTRQNRLQAQAASGQRIELPEDDPAGMRRVLDWQTEAARVDQYGDNIQRLQEKAQATYEIMRGLKRVSDRAQELALQVDDLKSPEQLKLYAVEITSLIKEAVQLANTSSLGEYLLAGTRNDQPPFVLATNQNGEVTGVAYQGNASVAEVEVGEGVTVSAQTLGANATGAGPRGLLLDTRFGVDLFGHLVALQNHLLTGDVGAVAAEDRPRLAQDEENLLVHYGENGAVQARLEASLALSQRRRESLEILVSQEADVDLAQTLVRLSQTQNAYAVALQSGARLLNTSLLDYLR